MSLGLTWTLNSASYRMRDIGAAEKPHAECLIVKDHFWTPGDPMPTPSEGSGL